MPTPTRPRRHGPGRATWRTSRVLHRHRWLRVVSVATLLVAAFWGVRLAQLATSVGRHAEHWAQPRGEPGGLLYVALGDSAAQGIGASRPDRGYVGLLADRLRARTGGPVLVVNLSVSGATVRDVLTGQVPRLAGLRPDVVTVAVGGNDIRSYDAARFAADARELVAALPPGTFVADVPYFMHGQWQDHAQEASAVMVAAAQGRGLPVAHLQQAQRARGARAMLTDFAADWFHPSDRGHRVWADAFWTEMERVPLPVRTPTP